MKIVFISLFLNLLFCNSSISQVFEGKIKGIVMDSISQSPIENATIQLKNESIIIKTILSKYDGSFNFQSIINNNYTLIISHIGYKTQHIPINELGEVMPEIKIQLQLDEIDLKEITVKANKPLVSQKNGEIAYQIEGGIWQNSGNAQNIINRIPILKGRSGGAYLLYGTKVVFLLDGKPMESSGMNLEAIMANIGSNEIDKIEILQSPPPSLARFGKPIVNIKTIKQKENGSLISLSQGFGRGKNNRFNNGAKYSFKENNFNLGLSFAQSQINQIAKTTSFKTATLLQMDDVETAKSKTNLYDFKISGGHSTIKSGIIGFSFDHRNFSAPTHKNTIGNYFVNGKMDNLELLAQAESKSFQNVTSLDYSKKFNQVFSVKTSIDLGKYGIKNEEKISVKRVNETENFENPWNRNINFKNFYVENESDFGEIKMTAGAYFKNSKSQTEFVKNVGTESNISDKFTYSEMISTGFVSSKYTKGKTDLTIGFNLEHTDIQGLSNLNIKNINFYSLLPSLNFNHQISDKNSINLSYSRGINRPEYEWLNQQELYKNPYNKNIGGGVLLPTIYNKVTATTTWQNGFSISGIYAHQKNRYSFFPLLNPGNSVNYSAINIQNFYYLYYSATYQKYLTNIWYFSTDISGYYSNLKSPDYKIKNSGYTQQFSFSNYFTFKKLGQFGLTSSYNTTDYADSYQFLPQFSVNIEYSKSIFRQNGSINISFSDLTNSLKDRFLYQLNNFSVRDNYKYETRLIKISINYKLGKKTVKTVEAKTKKSESEIERLK